MCSYTIFDFPGKFDVLEISLKKSSFVGWKQKELLQKNCKKQTNRKLKGSKG